MLKEFLKEQDLDFTVSKTPCLANINATEVLKNRYITYRTDTNKLFDVVSNKYTIIQNRDALEFLEVLVDSGDIELNKAFLVNDGAKYMLQCKINNNLILKNGDAIQKYITIINSHEGSWNCSSMITPVRLVCQNQFTFFTSQKDSQRIKIRHTANYKDKLDQAQKVLGITDSLYSQLEEQLNELIDNKVPDKNVEKIFKRVFYSPKEIKDETSVSTRKENIYKGVLDFYKKGIGQSNIQGTAFGITQAISGYYTHKGLDYQDLIMGVPKIAFDKAYSLF